MNGYLAFYNGKRYEVYADTLWKAKQFATDFFKPTKSKQHMVSVVLVEKDGMEVVAQVPG